MTTAKQEALESKVVCQVGLVVRDVETSAKAFADLLGVEVPPLRMTDPEPDTHVRYRGEPTKAKAKLAFFDAGSISIELIEPVGGPSTWKDFLDAHGEGVHHIAFRVEDMEGQVEMLAGKGMRPVQRGDYTGGCYTYIDSAPQLGVIIELLAKR